MASTLLFALVPVVFTVGLGWCAGLRGWVDRSATAMLGAFVAQFALPVSLFLAVVTVPRAGIEAELAPSLAYGAALLAGFAVAALHARRAGMAEVPASLYTLTVAMPNFGGIGLALFAQLGVPGGAVSLAVANIVGTLTVMLASFVRLELGAGSGDLARAVRGALLRPMTVVPTLGFLLAALEVPFPAIASAALQPLALATGGAGLFLTGVILSGQRLRLGRSDLVAALASAVLQPLVALLVCLALGLSADATFRAMVAMAIPSGFVGTILSSAYRMGGREAGGALVASTLLSAVTLPLWIALALSL